MKINSYNDVFVHITLLLLQAMEMQLESFEKPVIQHQVEVVEFRKRYRSKSQLLMSSFIESPINSDEDNLTKNELPSTHLE